MAIALLPRQVGAHALSEAIALRFDYQPKSPVAAAGACRAGQCRQVEGKESDGRPSAVPSNSGCDPYTAALCGMPFSVNSVCSSPD